MVVLLPVSFPSELASLNTTISALTLIEKSQINNLSKKRREIKNVQEKLLDTTLKAQQRQNLETRLSGLLSEENALKNSMLSALGSISSYSIRDQLNILIGNTNYSIDNEKPVGLPAYKDTIETLTDDFPLVFHLRKYL